MTNFERCQEFVLEWEGGISDDPEDAGGLTKYGVSIEYLRDLAATRPSVLRDILGTAQVNRALVKSLTKEQAGALFKWSFWDPSKLDAQPLPVALCMYDMSVNHGRKNAAKLIQRACNVMPSVYPKLAVDGVPGPKTYAAMRFLNCPDGIGAVANKRQAFYDAIVANRPRQRVFLKGWTRRCNAMRRTALAWLKEE